jgi:hypothetical protein
MYSRCSRVKYSGPALVALASAERKWVFSHRESTPENRSCGAYFLFGREIGFP